MSIYETLNPMQQEAVYHTEGPLLILAGAGSGKTRVLTHRIVYLIEEKKVNPWNIMAITFTNKAAGEMRERVDKIVEFGSESIWVSTFHSTCVRILRRYIDRLGYENNFTIYDTDDQKTLLRQVFKIVDVDTNYFKERSVLSEISSAKNAMITPEQMLKKTAGDYRKSKIAQIYKEYQKQLFKNNALDFDDLLVKTVELFNMAPDVLESYQERFKYIMVDEYQDTNGVQFQIISLLARRYQNLCVVGDDDQSIYKFRGADIENILNFEKVFSGTKVIKLEQNYRSTKNILGAANEVIKNNRGRKDKTLWTDNNEGSLVNLKQFNTAYEEADYVIKSIKNSDKVLNEFAVLYRTNAQSRLMEEKCITYNIPYKLVGGVNFYQRKEIKDILAYLKTVDNGRDDIAVQRIINVPKRGIGAATLGKVAIYAQEQELSFYDALKEAELVPGLGKAIARIDIFTGQIQTLRSKRDYLGISGIIKDVLDSTGYLKELELEDTVESRTRIENIEELISKAASFESEHEVPTLSEFLEEIALVADVDSLDQDDNRLTLMTLHSAKGLEFKFVYLVGLEDGLFPSQMSIDTGDLSDIEEERRLCYVGITRAETELTITYSRQRMINGKTIYSKLSRFIDEIPKTYLQFPNAANSSLTSGGNKSISGNITSGEDRFTSMPYKSNAYASKTSAFAPTKTNFGKDFTVTKLSKLEYGIGDSVKHIRFGAGKVTNIVESKKDYEVTVDFEKSGIKKMFASFAKLVKI
jgi:Superfamily I DNA and RNA helicases